MAKRIFLFLFLAAVVSVGATFAQQTTAFSYQGRLTEAGGAATGTRYFRFTLFDENGAAIAGATIEQTLTVTTAFSIRRSISGRQTFRAQIVLCEFPSK